MTQLALAVDPGPDPDAPEPGVTKVRIKGERGTFTFKGIRAAGTEAECVVLMSEDQQWRNIKGDRVQWPKPKRKRRRRTPK